MKFYTLIIVITLLASCQKDSENIGFSAGETNNVIVTNRDSTAQGIYSDPNQFPPTNHDYIYLDLDGDGSNDLYFKSSEDSNYHTHGLSNPDYKIFTTKLRVLNSQFSVAHIKNSEKTFEHSSEPVYDYYGTFPRKTTTKTLSCDSSANSVYLGSTPIVRYLNRTIPISMNLEWQSIYSEFILQKTEPDNLYYNASNGQDSLIGYHIINNLDCQSMPFDTPYYIPFMKTLGNQHKYGWILLDLTDNNKITVYKTAIQNEYN